MKLDIYQGDIFVKEVEIKRLQETSGGGYAEEEGNRITQKLDLFLEDQGQPLETVAKTFQGEKLILCLKQEQGDLKLEGYQSFSVMRNLGDYEGSLLVTLVKFENHTV